VPDVGAPSLLVVDNHDSFTFTLVDYLLSQGARVDVAQSDAMTVEEALARGRDGLVISPGPGRPEDAGISVSLARACIDERRPLLGVCLGMQAIAIACGAAVERVPPVHGKAGAIRHDGSGLFAGLPSPITATRYHSLAVTGLTDSLTGNAWSEDGVIQGIRHTVAPVHGVQFHPESIASTHGHALLRTFVECCA
jgi:anthranilate synthase component 2